MLAYDTKKPRISLRASIVLACLNGASCKAVAEALDIDEESVILWRQRFQQYGISGLRDTAKYKDRKIIGEDPLKQPVLELLAQDPPPGQLYWSTRNLAETLQVSPREIQRCLHREHIKLLEQRIALRQRKWARRFGNGETVPAASKPQEMPEQTIPEASETPPEQV